VPRPLGPIRWSQLVTGWEILGCEPRAASRESGERTLRAQFVLRSPIDAGLLCWLPAGEPIPFDGPIPVGGELIRDVLASLLGWWDEGGSEAEASPRTPDGGGRSTAASAPRRDPAQITRLRTSLPLLRDEDQSAE
jgi:hypothetical protein